MSMGEREKSLSCHWTGHCPDRARLSPVALQNAPQRFSARDSTAENTGAGRGPDCKACARAHVDQRDAVVPAESARSDEGLLMNI